MNWSKSSFFIGLLSFSIAFVANAADLPRPLIYQEKPVDALCFYETNEMQGDVDLTQCGLHHEPGRAIAGENNMLIDQGFYGYDYSWALDAGPKMQGYSYYKPLGQTNDSTLIETVNNSGGTGSFSALILVKRQGNHLKLKTLNSGDRCNNGIKSASTEVDKKGKKVIYAIHITAFDFLTLADDNPHDLKAYDDLDSCAACCAATAVYSRSLTGDVYQETFLYVDLSNVPDSMNDMNNDSGVKYQKCFNELLVKYKKANQSKLNLKALKSLTHEFNKQCVT